MVAKRTAARVARISKRTVDGLECEAGSAYAILWDDRLKGFGVKATATGAKSYLVQYRMGGRDTRVRKVVLGRHGSPYTAESAREHAERLLHDVRGGVDPVEAERASRAKVADDARFEFSVFVERFMERHVRANELRSEADIEGTFRRDLTPRFAGRSIRDIKSSEIKAALGEIGDRSQSAANKAYKWLSCLYSWGQKKDDLDASPMGGVGKPAPEGKRQRYLNEGEIVLLVSILHAMSRQFAALILLLLLTGQRLREVAGMRWEEIDLTRGEWIVPGARTKNKLDHLVPITPQMLAVLLELDPPADGLGFVLTTTGRTPISGFSDMKEEIDELIAEARDQPMPPWVVHDLRRTFRTGCSQLRLRPDHAEAVMNHVSAVTGGIEGVYNVYKYAKEKRLVLNRWAKHVEKVVGGVPSIAANRPARVARGAVRA